MRAAPLANMQGAPKIASRLRKPYVKSPASASQFLGCATIFPPRIRELDPFVSPVASIILLIVALF